MSQGTCSVVGCPDDDNGAGLSKPLCGKHSQAFLYSPSGLLMVDFLVDAALALVCTIKGCGEPGNGRLRIDLCHAHYLEYNLTPTCGDGGALEAFIALKDAALAGR